MTADGFIRLGLISQLLLLVLLDWGSLHAFQKHGMPWYHFVGFVVVNAVLLTAFVLCWRWMRQQQASASQER